MRTARRPSTAEHCRIFIGTSGFSYTDWIEAGFYPQGTPGVGMLPWYARCFQAVELVQTWHQLPRPEIMDRLRGQVPPDFLFTAKLHRSLTHEFEPDRWRERAAAFRYGLAPLIQSGQLAAVLVELPADFDRSVANRRRLAQVLDELDGLPLAVEFRQGSWNNEKVFQELEKRGTTLVTVDTPELPGLFPGLDVATNPNLAYVRLHGRNPGGWQRGHRRDQFDYAYPEAQLRELAENRLAPLLAATRTALVFCNNHVRGQAPETARTLARILSEAGHDMGPR